MNELDMQFHTAVFGGFQKQDVMSYLESSAQENSQKFAELQRQLSEETESRIQAEQDLDEAKKSLIRLESEKKTLSRAVSEQKNQLCQMQKQLEELAAERDELWNVRDRLTKTVDRLKPLAQHYEAIKERTAGIELEAHGRAQVIENEAREKARNLQREMDDWCGHLQGIYAELRQDSKAALNRASQELEHVNQYLASLSAAYADHEKILTQLRQNVEHITGPKAPRPIPEVED